MDPAVADRITRRRRRPAWQGRQVATDRRRDVRRGLDAGRLL